MTFFSASCISKNYEHHQALNNISFSIQGGRITGLLGPNGAGKSSLLRIITGILKPDSGSLHFGFPTHRIGYLPEERGLYQKMNVFELLLFLGRLKGLSKKESTTRSLYWLKEYELKDWKDRKVEELSKGMQQKLQMIGAILHNPDLLILDEPFSGFDPIAEDLAKNILLRLSSEGKTIILSTHRMDSVQSLCSDIIFLNQGKIIFQGPIAQLKERFRVSHLMVHATEGINELPSFKIRSVKKQTNTNEYLIEPTPTHTISQVLTELIQNFTISSFYQVEPEMEYIFLQLARSK